MSTISQLNSEILKVIWGKTRQARAMEVVFGLLYEATDYHPRSAMIWNTMANARRMLMKDDSIKQHAIKVSRIREKRGMEDHEDKVEPRIRLKQKTRADDVDKRNQTWLDYQQVNRNGIAKAEPNRNTTREEVDRTSIAKAEPNRSDDTNGRQANDVEIQKKGC